MTTTDLKKILYKEKPIAYMSDDGVSGIRGASAVTIVTYKANTSVGLVQFCVPTHEMGEKMFGLEEPAQLLIRWIEIERFKHDNG